MIRSARKMIPYSIAGVLAVLFMTSCVLGEVTNRVDTFGVGVNPELQIISGEGDVHVRVGDPGVITVETEMIRPEKLEYEVTQEGNMVTVRALKSADAYVADPRTNIEVTLPSNTVIDIVIGNGAVGITGLNADGKIALGNGTARLEQVSGNYSVMADNGSITVENATGAFRLSTGNGGIDFTGLFRNGGINEFTVGHGDISIEPDADASVVIDAEAHDGGIDNDLITEFSLSESGRLIGTLGGGAASLRISAGEGNITLR